MRPVRTPATGLADVDRALLALRDDLGPVFRAELLDAQWVRVSRSKAPSGTPWLFALDGSLTKDIALKSGLVNVLPHRFGQAPTGRLIVYQSAQAVIWDKEVTALSPAFDPTRYLGLECSSDVTVRLLVFLCPLSKPSTTCLLSPVSLSKQTLV